MFVTIASALKTKTGFYEAGNTFFVQCVIDVIVGFLFLD
jgi:hypothetical protein